MIRLFSKVFFVNLAGPLVAFITTPVISRLCTPDVFGGFFYVSLISALLALIYGGTYFNAIYGANLLSAAKRTCVLSTLEIIKFSSVSMVVFVVIFFVFNNEKFLSISLLALILSFLISINANFVAYLVRSGNVNLLLMSILVKCGTLAFLQIFLCGVLNNGLYELTVSAILSEAIFLLLVIFRLKKDLFFYFNLYFKNKGRYKNKESRYRKYYLPAQIIGQLGNFIPVLFLWFSSLAEWLGIYGMIFRLFAVPMNAIANSVKSVYWRMLSGKETNEQIQIARNVFSLIWIFILSIVVGFYYIKINLMEGLLGNAWAGANQFVPLAVLWFGGVFSLIFYSELLKNTNQQKFILLIEIVSVVIKIAFLSFFYVLNIGGDFFVYAIFFIGIISNCISVLMISKKLDVIGKA